jgi:hypothetical protein
MLAAKIPCNPLKSLVSYEGIQGNPIAPKRVFAAKGRGLKKTQIDRPSGGSVAGEDG